MSHYQPIRDFRIKDIHDWNKKHYWINLYKIYKEAINDHRPLISVLPSHPDVIKFIKNPTKDDQLAAVLSNPPSIKYIKNPDPYVQLRAVKVMPDLIRYVKYPTDEMWIWAIDYDPGWIFHVPKPSWPMVTIAQERKLEGVNSHKGLTDEMRAYLTLVA